MEENKNLGVIEKVDDADLEQIAGGSYQKIKKGDKYFQFYCTECNVKWIRKNDNISDKDCPNCKSSWDVMGFEKEYNGESIF